jgi:hypothetical protein
MEAQVFQIRSSPTSVLPFSPIESVRFGQSSVQVLEAKKSTKSEMERAELFGFVHILEVSTKVLITF